MFLGPAARKHPGKCWNSNTQFSVQNALMKWQQDTDVHQRKRIPSKEIQICSEDS